MKSVISNLMTMVTALTLVACGSTGGGMGDGGSPPVEIRTGTIEQINATEVKSTHNQGLIAVGAIAGAIGGNVAQNRFFDKPQPAQQVIVRLASGVLVAITQPVNPGLSRGMRVYVEGQGHEARVVPA